jgi:hypothetical protein
MSITFVALPKKDKGLYMSDLKVLLWAGQTTKAIEYIDKMERVRNEEKRDELRTYLDKHALEIIDYGLRQKAKKTIGSGRVEKGNDLIVAHRQKKKGMAWSKSGSSALAIIKVNRLNNELKQ